MHRHKNAKKYTRLATKFYRIQLASEKSIQTIALVPDDAIAHELTKLLNHHVKIREDQRFHCSISEIRPIEPESANESDSVWDVTNRA